MNILLVCTGNISRSPAAERLLAAKLGPTVRVASAGTRAVVGQPMDERMVPYLNDVHTGGFVARQLEPSMVCQADLVLAMTDSHRGAILRLEPSAVRRTFTLSDFARWAAGAAGEGLPGGTPAQRLAAVVARVPDLRTRFPRGRAPGDVPDPFGYGEAAYVRAVELIRAATDAIAWAVRPQA